jgi:hypothetical protein
MSQIAAVSLIATGAALFIAAVIFQIRVLTVHQMALKIHRRLIPHRMAAVEEVVAVGTKSILAWV